MKFNNIVHQELESLALDLLDFCGGELTTKGIANFWRLKDKEYSVTIKNYVEQVAEQLITNP